MPTAAIYARISRDPHRDHLGVDRQETDCRALCDQRGWDIGEVFADDDRSAYSGKPRPGYLALLDGLRAGRFGAIVAWHPDRLHRSPRELEDFIDLIESSGARVATVQAGEYDLGTAAGRMTARVVGAVARHESEHKSERLRRKHVELAETGKVSGGGSRPFGFEADRVTIRRSEAALIREAADAILAGMTLRGLTADWNRRGVATVAGQPWRTPILRRLLCSPRVAGMREHQGRIAGRAVWEPILDERTSARLRALLLDPSRRVNASPRRYLLTGVARCGVCGARLVARPRSDKRRSYVCASGPNFDGCGKIRVLADPFEDYVAGRLIARLTDPSFLNDLAGQGDGADDALAEVAAIEDRLEELARVWASGDLSMGEWTAARQALESRLSAARRLLVRSAEKDRLAVLTGADGDMATRWDVADFDRRRAYVTAAVDSVTVLPALKGRNWFDEERVADGIVWRV